MSALLKSRVSKPVSRSRIFQLKSTDERTIKIVISKTNRISRIDLFLNPQSPLKILYLRCVLGKEIYCYDTIQKVKPISSPFLRHNVLLNFRRTEQAVLSFSRPIVLCRSVASAKKQWQSLKKLRLFRSCDAVIDLMLSPILNIFEDTPCDLKIYQRKHCPRFNFFHLYLTFLINVVVKMLSIFSQ